MVIGLRKPPYSVIFVLIILSTTSFFLTIFSLARRQNTTRMFCHLCSTTVDDPTEPANGHEFFYHPR